METRTEYTISSNSSGILNDIQIADLAINDLMINPYYENKIRFNQQGERVISFGQNSYGYDVTLANEFTTYIGNTIVDPKNPTSLSVYNYITNEPYFDLEPNTAILAHTIEEVKMPPDVTGIVLGKSTYCRCGLLINTTPLEAGWCGQITLELRNLETHPIRLYVGEGIAQILFFKGNLPPKEVYNGTYQGQSGVTLPFNPS